MTRHTLQALGMKTFVCTIILMCLIGTGSLVYCALRDASFAVEPDYYAKSLEWNATARQQTQNQTLGWSISISSIPGSVGSPNERVWLLVLAHDRAGAPLSEATLTAEAFPNARASERQTLVFLPTGSPGEYTCELKRGTLGTYRIRLCVQHKDDTFTYEVDHDPSHAKSPVNNRSVLGSDTAEPSSCSL